MMSTRAPFPATAPIDVKELGGLGLIATSSRSAAEIRVRAVMFDFATTTFGPVPAAGKM